MQDWRNEVTQEMLPLAHRKLADVIGVEATIRLCEMFGGESLYIPMADTVYAAVRRKWIQKEFDLGADTKNLARKYELSKREVQRIVRGGFANLPS